MTSFPQSLSELQAVFNGWARTFETVGAAPDRIDFTRSQMPGILLNRPLMQNILNGIVRGKQWPDVRKATLFENEFILYINNKRLFSARLYIFDPGEYTPAHDHSSWGVYGCVSERIEVVKYRRQDDESRPGYARLQETDRVILQPGDTSVVGPLNDGIHQAGNPGSGTCVMMSVYGTPLRRIYVNEYDPIRNRVTRRYHPRLAKKRLASRAVESFASPSG